MREPYFLDAARGPILEPALAGRLERARPHVGAAVASHPPRSAKPEYGPPMTRDAENVSPPDLTPSGPFVMRVTATHVLAYFAAGLAALATMQYEQRFAADSIASHRRSR